MKPIEFLEHYRNNMDFYLPMIDHVSRYFPGRDEETGDINIGWDCGAIGRRPYFLECWSAENVTMITFFISVIGIESYDAEDIEKMLTGAGLYSKKEGYVKAQILPVKDSGDNYFFSVNIVVGREDEDAIIDGAVVYPYKWLNKHNGYIGLLDTISEKTSGDMAMFRRQCKV